MVAQFFAERQAFFSMASIPFSNSPALRYDSARDVRSCGTIPSCATKGWVASSSTTIGRSLDGGLCFGTLRGKQCPQP